MDKISSRDMVHGNANITYSGLFGNEMCETSLKGKKDSPVGIIHNQIHSTYFNS